MLIHLWPDAYVYVDWNADGQFDYSLYDNGGPADGSEIVAYSYAENRDSRGNFLTSRPAAPSLPSFRIPADTRPGVYRMRIKIDSNSTDPAGSDDIISAGGSTDRSHAQYSSPGYHCRRSSTQW